MQLSEVSRLVTEKSGGVAPPVASPDRAIARRMVITLSWGMALLLLGVATLAAGKKIAQNQIVEIIGGCILLLSGALMSYAVFSAMLAGTRDSKSGAKPRRPTRPELDAERIASIPIEPPAPVTEETTRLIQNERD